MYDAARAEHAVQFIRLLRHVKGDWHGKPFNLLPWQERLIRDVFGTLTADGRRQYRTAYVELPKKSGKQLALDTPIPTPTGLVTMGEIAVGDTVFDEHGQPCRVVAKSAVDYHEPAYRLTFKDGEAIEAGASHQWYGEWYSNHGLISGVVTTQWLHRRAQAPSRQRARSVDFRIPLAAALELPAAVLPIEPYTFGFWLGNGNAVKPEITIRTGDVAGVLAQVEPHHQVTSSWENVGGSWVFRVPDLRRVLLSSYRDRAIPMAYLRGSYEQRLRLLQGLMDSDGCIAGRKGQAAYSSISRTLAETVSALLWTLGIKNAISADDSTQRADWAQPSAQCGRVDTGETVYYVKFTAFTDTATAGLDRKQARAVLRNPGSRSHFRYIDRIEPVPNRGMQCLQVDSSSRLYLAGRSGVPTHNSQLAAAVALYLLCADGEERAEVYGCAADRPQASIVFEVALDMVQMCPALKARCKLLPAAKRIIYEPTRSYYQVLSAESYSKHGVSVHGVIFDELHAQPTRELYDVMTHGAGDARRQPLHLVLTTAGADRNSIAWEVHQKARDLLDGRRRDHTFYPVIYAADEDDDWTDPAVWAKANPSLGVTVTLERMRAACESARSNPAEENLFRRFRLNQWVKQSTRWMPMEAWDQCAAPVDAAALAGRECYAGLDLSSTTDLTALVLVFPPRAEAEPYQVLPFFWLPEETLPLRVRRDHVMYDVWERQGYLRTTEGNVVHYAEIERVIAELAERYQLREVAFDRWGAVQMAQNLEAEGLTVVPFGQGFRSLSPPTKELMKLTLERKLAHGGHPVLRWMLDNVTVHTDPAGNIKPDKVRSSEKIDGALALIMALDRALRHQGEQVQSVYDQRGVLTV